MAASIKPRIEVGAGLVFRTGRLLITQRPPGCHLAGFWEFPGGKRELNESFESCIEREIHEELGIRVQARTWLTSVSHTYPTKIVQLEFYICDWLSGEPLALECSDFRWLDREDLGGFIFPEADLAVIELLRSRTDLWER